MSSLNASQKEYILRHNRHRSIRQLAKELSVSREDIRKVLDESEAGQSSPTRIVLSKKWEMIVVGVILALALGLRFLYLAALKQTAFFEPLTHELDDAIYHATAQAIAAGNWLADTPFSAYRIPLYAYFLSGVYFLFGVANLMVAHLVQSIGLGLGSIFLVYLLAKRAFNDVRIAACAGFLFAIHLPFIFFENILVGESLSIFLSLLALWFLADLRANAVRFSIAGTLFGLASLARPNLLLCALAVGVYLFYLLRKTQKESAIFLAVVFFLSIATPLAVNAARHYKLHRDFIPLSAIAGVNLYIGNSPFSDGKFKIVPGLGTDLKGMIENSIEMAEKEKGVTLKPSQISSYWSMKAVSFALSSPVQEATLILKKVFYFLNTRELTDILNMYFVANFIPFLKIGFFQYGLLILFALYFFVFCRNALNDSGRILAVFGFSYFASILIFFVTARYRLPVVPVLCIFAGFGLWHSLEPLTRGHPKNFYRLLIVVIPAAFLVFWPIESDNFATDYNSLAIYFAGKGDWVKSEENYRNAIAIAPDYPSPYHNLAIVLRNTDREEEAEVFEKTFIEKKALWE